MRNNFAHHRNEQHLDEALIYIHQSNKEFGRLKEERSIRELFLKHERWLVFVEDFETY